MQFDNRIVIDEIILIGHKLADELCQENITAENVHANKVKLIFVHFNFSSDSELCNLSSQRNNFETERYKLSVINHFIFHMLYDFLESMKFLRVLDDQVLKKI